MPDTVDFSRKPVLVLGASGFIGARVVAALATNPMFRPVPASRHSGLMLDATSPTALRGALADMPFVVNCIAGNPRVMVQSTQALCEAARALPPRRIVHLSSMAVYGSATGVVREDRAPVDPVTGYGQAKIECERIIRKFCDDGGEAVILRPTCVFGPGSPQWTTRLARLLQARRIGDLGTGGDGCCNLAFIDDLVTAIVTSLHVSDLNRQAFNISGPTDLTWNQFLITFARALGATPVRRIPRRRMRIETKVLAPLRKLAAKAVQCNATEAITPSLAALWQQDIRIDCTAARDRLALRQTPVNDMIAAVIANDRLVRELVHS